jgi:hypothetical protein
MYLQPAVQFPEPLIGLQRRCASTLLDHPTSTADDLSCMGKQYKLSGLWEKLTSSHAHRERISLMNH